MALRWRIVDSQPKTWQGGTGTCAVITGPATLEYSIDDGVNWTIAGIDVGVDAAVGTSFNFQLPGTCLIRVTGGSCRIGDVSTPSKDSMNYTVEE